MTINEMRSCAYETLRCFMRTMPNVPFKKEDIIIAFAHRNDMAERVKKLCVKYIPDKIINENQIRQLNRDSAAYALIGREKSIVVACINHKTSGQNWRQIFFHEFAHIYCVNTEVDGEHFIDVYGDGYALETRPDNEIHYDNVNAGYEVWSEFIAEYLSIIKVPDETYSAADIKDYVCGLLKEVSLSYLEDSKTSFAIACAYLLTCGDADTSLQSFPDEEDNDGVPYKKENKIALLDCLRYLNEHMHGERPWKISEEFIEILGGKYIWFKTTNSLYMAYGDGKTVTDSLRISY